MRRLPSGTVTFVFTDIEGSTRLLHELGDRYADALADHRRVLREAFRAHTGVEVDTQGDAFFYAFGRAADAIAAAEAAQEAMAPGPIRVRIGLHTGEPQLTDEGYVGLDVHTGARLAACSHGGQVVLSKLTKELAGDGFSFRDLGEHRLKDLAEPVWLYQLGSASFPPLKSLSNTNLPTPASSFLGREAELEQARVLLQKARLTTVSGPGGTGKTRFAIELASRQLEDFTNGVFWVPLADLRDPELVVEQAARVVGARDSLAAHIADKRMLLLFDNFEQVVAAAAALPELLRACPNLTLLVTSRETLRVEGEAEYTLAPLAEDEGVALFCARAGVQPNEAIRELCVRLDGLPLAIELAAARAKVLSPEELLARLSQRLDLLKGGRDAESRHATLRATITWSYELLTEEERRLFARMAAFAGGCALEAAEDVCAADVDTLQSLLEKSLLRRTDGRFWMLETIREFATERLEELAEAEALRAAHAAWYARLAEDGEEGIRREGEGWLKRLERELGNFRAALEWTSARSRHELFVRLAGALGVFWFLRAQLTEARRWLTEALVRPVPSPHLRGKVLASTVMVHLWQGEMDEADRRSRELLALGPEVGARGRADALHIRGVIESMRGRFERATALYEQSAAISRQAGELWLLRQTINNLGDAALNLGELRRAETYFEEALALGEPGLGSGRAGAVAALGNLGMLAALRGDRDRARQRFEAALQMVRESGLRESAVTGPLLVGSAWVAASGGEEASACRLLAAADSFLEETGVTMRPYEVDVHDRAAMRIGRALPDHARARLAAEGRRLGFDGAVEHALASEDSAASAS